ncbi:hypothetical protein [Nocardioides sp. ChNu-99]|uniref:hypothetical protein n=1 Tax=Nocardioides sp. ChNu-99 TaxID=2839897 RepID=UPI002406AD07|nr:hypothetical protein [Nocardioides sp. ChNu-99]MDF9717374.1 hypothetical protein [Nocardioides sp. ChNu-99]
MSASTPDLPALRAEIERLKRWKAEATSLFDGLQDLGRALGLPLGTLITGPSAVDTARSLRAERDALAARLAAQPVAPAPDRDALAEALRDVFRGDEYEENAAAAAGEGEWSWFAWLAATAGVDAVLDALAARPAPSGDADLAARVQADVWVAISDGTIECVAESREAATAALNTRLARIGGTSHDDGWHQPQPSDDQDDTWWRRWYHDPHIVVGSQTRSQEVRRMPLVRALLADQPAATPEGTESDR